MNLLRKEDISGKQVISSDGYIVGEVSDIGFRLDGTLCFLIKLKTGEEVEIPLSGVSAVGDVVILKINKDSVGKPEAAEAQPSPPPPPPAQPSQPPSPPQSGAFPPPPPPPSGQPPEMPSPPSPPQPQPPAYGYPPGQQAPPPPPPGGGVVCSNCGTVNPPDAVVCMNCGAPLKREGGGFLSRIKSKF